MPEAVLLEPVVLFWRACVPEAVLEEPVVLAWRALVPVAVFWVPVVLFWRALVPRAVFWTPKLVLFMPALRPINMLLVLPELRTSSVATLLLFLTVRTEPT